MPDMGIVDTYSWNRPNFWPLMVLMSTYCNSGNRSGNHFWEMLMKKRLNDKASIFTYTSVKIAYFIFWFAGLGYTAFNITSNIQSYFRYSDLKNTVSFICTPNWGLSFLDISSTRRYYIYAVIPVILSTQHINR